MNDLLQYLPPITDSHREALNAVLNETSDDPLLEAAELVRRRNFAESVCSALAARIEGLLFSITSPVYKPPSISPPYLPRSSNECRW